jgi:hypothetical protein
MKKTLHEITEDALAIYENVEELDGELTEEMQEALIINEGQLQSKGIAYLEIIKQRKAYIAMVDAELKRLQALKKASNRLVDNLEFNLLGAQKAYGDFDLGLTTITTRKSESIQVLDVNSLPNEFKTIKVVETADKKALKEAIKKGAKIEGVELVINQNLRIK